MTQEAEKELTSEEKIKIWHIIGQRMAPDDKHPRVVIRDDFEGDEDRYLKAMARWHNVSIDSYETDCQNTEKNPVIKAIIETNSIISEEQYQKLAQAIGREVTVEYKKSGYEVDEESSYKYTSSESFFLKDFRFVVSEETQRKYLACLVHAEKYHVAKHGVEGKEEHDQEYDVWFHPAIFNYDVTGSTHRTGIINVKDKNTGEILWSFDGDNPKKYIDLDSSVGITSQNIAAYSLSYLESVK